MGRVDKHGPQDVGRGWGQVPVQADHPTFRETDYLLDVLLASGPLDPAKSREAHSLFKEELAKLAPQFELEVLAEAGSDALNYALSIAIQHGRERLAPRVGALTAAERVPVPAIFEGDYGAARGVLAGNGAFRSTKSNAGAISLADTKVPSPTSLRQHVTAPAELAKLRQAEAATLAQIRELAGRTGADQRAIGAIIIEPIQAPYYKPMRFYRPEFLIELRRLADELHLPIIADETLTGGGRTGELFAFQHYPGFEPDFVVFGKAMMVNGVGSWRRAGHPAYEFPKAMVTLEGDPARLLRAAQWLKCLNSGTLENIVAIGEAINASTGPEVFALGCLVNTNDLYAPRELVAFDLTPEQAAALYAPGAVRRKS
jgi:4-aminobutyrate aminotransferase-like enzyme